MSNESSKLETFLFEVQNAVADIDRMNAGGCAVFAGLVSRRLNKIGFKAKVRVGDVLYNSNEKNRLKDAKKNGARKMGEFGEQGICFWHLIVEITDGKQKYHFDSESLVKAKKNLVLFPNAQVYNGALTPAETLILARSKGWNWMFNRKQIPTLIKRLNEVFRRADEILGNCS